MLFAYCRTAVALRRLAQVEGYGGYGVECLKEEGIHKESLEKGHVNCLINKYLSSIASPHSEGKTDNVVWEGREKSYQILKG